jgi:hypothetical protein
MFNIENISLCNHNATIALQGDTENAGFDHKEYP